MTTEPKRPDRAAFHQMKDGTQADWAIIGRHFRPLVEGLPDRTLAHLRLLAGDHGGYALAAGRLKRKGRWPQVEQP